MIAPAPAAHLTDADRTLAAEYVLGTLDSEERQTVRARIAADPSFAGLVRLWERRLSPLHELAVPVTPPPSIWRVIVADLKAAPPATPSRTPRKVPTPAEPAPRPVVGEARPGRAPAPRSQGPMAAVRRLFGLARPGRGAVEGPTRPKRPLTVPAPPASPVPAALRVPGGRTLGGAIQDAVAAGLLPPAPPLPEPPPQAAAPERADPLPPPLKLAPPAPPRPRPVPEPLTPPPAFIFLEPDPPPAAEGSEIPVGVEQAAPAPPAADEGPAAPAVVSPPPTFTFLEPAAPPAAAPADTAGVDQAMPVPPSTEDGAPASAAVSPPAFTFLEPNPPPVLHAPESAAGADQAVPAPLSDDVTPPPAPPGSPVPAASGVRDVEATTNPSLELTETVALPAPPDAATLPLAQVSEASASIAEGDTGPQVPAELPSTAPSDGPQKHAGLETVPTPAEAADAGASAEPRLQSTSEAGHPGTTEAVAVARADAAAAAAASPHAQPAEGPAGAGAPAPEALTEPSAFKPAVLQAALAEPSPAPSTLAKAAAVEPPPIEPAAEPPSADPAAGAKGEEAPPLPGWAAVVASGVVSALPDPAAVGDEPTPDDVLRRPMRRRAFPWQTVALTLAALLVAVAAFAAYREWFWPRDGQWVGVLQSEPLPSIAVRLDPDSGVILVRSFAPAPPEGEINRLWLLVPDRPAVLLGEFTAGLSGRAPALAGLGRSRLGTAEVVVTQEPKLGSGAAPAEGPPPGKVIYRGRLAPE